MPVQSAGILLYRRLKRTEVLLIHPGGPYWAKKDIGAWSIPKGIVTPQEDPLVAARREFHEETGFVADGHALHLGIFRQPSGKQLTVWAVAGDLDPACLTSNSFSMIWPPKSGILSSFPEADRGAWFAHNQGVGSAYLCEQH